MNNEQSSAVGWHADPQDPATTRYWNGRRWTGQRRWSGAAWVEVPLVPPAGAEALAAAEDASTAPGAAPSDGVAGGISAVLNSTSTTFKVFVGAAFGCVLSYFVPVTTVTSGSGYSETHSLTEAGGFGVLMLAVAAATVWFAWPSRHGGLVTQRALWGLVGMVGIIVLFTVAVLGALGSKEEDLVLTTMSKTVEPSLGFYLLLAGGSAELVGICLAIRDRRGRQGDAAPSRVPASGHRN